MPPYDLVCQQSTNPLQHVSVEIADLRNTLVGGEGMVADPCHHLLRKINRVSCIRALTGPYEP